jgi:hypothetical protein
MPIAFGPAARARSVVLPEACSCLIVGARSATPPDHALLDALAGQAGPQFGNRHNLLQQEAADSTFDLIGSLSRISTLTSP